MVRLSLLTTFLLATLVAPGQDSFIRSSTGFVRCNINSRADAQYKYKSGISTLITFNRKLNDQIYWGLGLSYQNLGFRIELVMVEEIGGQLNPIGVSLENWNFEYLSIPVYLGYQTGSRYKFIAELGFVPGVLTRSVLTVPVPGGSTDQDVTEFIDRLNLPISGVLGVRRELNELYSFDLTISYQQGINNIEFSNLSERNKNQHHAFIFSLGMAYKF